MTSPATSPNTRSTLNGPLLLETLQQPICTLRFYTFGITREHIDPLTGELTDTAIDPADLADIFGKESLGFSSGLLADDIIYTGLKNGQQQLLSYRPPQMTGLYLEGSAKPLRVPLPGLLFYHAGSRRTPRPKQMLFAVKARPMSLAEKLYHAPLPNVYSKGNLCWGTVEQPAINEQLVSLRHYWTQFLGSAFGSHVVSGKSQQYPADIRQQFIALDEAGAKDYPLADLVEMPQTTLQTILEGTP